MTGAEARKREVERQARLSDKRARRERRGAAKLQRAQAKQASTPTE